MSGDAKFLITFSDSRPISSMVRGHEMGKACSSRQWRVGLRRRYFVLHPYTVDKAVK